jgi:RsmE family RNA methyltransferase
LNLIILEPGEVAPDRAVRLDGPRAVHATKVLGVVVGQTVRVGVLDGALGVATVQAVEDGVVELSCVLEAAPPPVPRVDLLLAVPRPKVMRRLWAQLAALGVGRVILTNAEKVERPYFDTHVLTPECYRPLLVEGLQQARDTRLPVVSIHRRFKVLVEDELDALSGAGVRLVADPDATIPVREGCAAALVPDPDARLLLAVGPEGGWNRFELNLLEAHGFTKVGMGARTLRTDTACIALLALAHDALEG